MISARERELLLQSPRLSLTEFESALAPFLERDLLRPREDDYRVTCSIFAPIEDALSRGRLEADAIELCLLVGGSTLIPQVCEALAGYFANAAILAFEDREEVQTAVAQGAAVHALSLALTGKGIFQPVCQDDIQLETRQGALPLIAAGTPLPFPAGEGFQRRDDLTAPQEIPAGRQGAIRVLVTAGAERRELFQQTWELRGPIRKGEKLTLEYRYDENQVLWLRVSRQAAPECEFRGHVENPLTHVVNPSKTRQRIQEVEEQLRTEQISGVERQRSLEELGDLYRELGQYEKALAFYRQALVGAEKPGACLLNRMAFCARDLGDRDRAEKLFREAARVEDWSGTFFNWALARWKWGDSSGALALVERAIRGDDEPAYRVLQAQLLRTLGRWEQAQRVLQEALARFGPPEMLNDFELFWLAYAAQLVGDKALEERVQRLQQSRATPSTRAARELPDLARPHQH
ncbi:MAG: tetratricopeptide repeat protein [Bryobacterales bacterium]|nr:tetratricopeptide repeat protein [Bryobacterales bacterium]